MTPYTCILTLAKLKYFMSKNLSTTTFIIKLLPITRGDIQSVEPEISSAKVKPDMPTQNFDQKKNF